MHGGFASLEDEANAFLPSVSQRVIGVAGTFQVYPQPITTISIMLTDEEDEGDDGDAKKSNVVVAINCITCF